MTFTHFDFKLNFKGTIHFVGIGGIGMSGIAYMLHSYGFDVQGSDVAQNDNTERLEGLGIKIFYSQCKENLENVTHLVASSAISENNPEIVEAKKRNIPLMKRAEMLAELMRLKLSIAVSGAHGKTTTTSLISAMFENNALEPSVINGGIITGKGTNSYTGKGNYLIVEADESDGTFILVPSVIAVITNIDREHMDYYKDFDVLKNAYQKFIQNLPFYGFSVICKDNQINREVASRIQDKEIIFYSLEDKTADVYGTNIQYGRDGIYFDVHVSSRITGNKPKLLENIFLPLYGDHNVLNALAAITIACKLDFKDEKIITGFSDFQGVKRRFNFVGNFQKSFFIDDYAHHPEEIKTTLKTAEKIVHLRSDLEKVVAVVQPHRYSRLNDLFEEFSSCYESADEIIITDVYSAGEKNIFGLDVNKLPEMIQKNYPSKKVFFAKDFDILTDHILQTNIAGNLYVFMGAGNISTFSRELAEKLKKKLSKGTHDYVL